MSIFRHALVLASVSAIALGAATSAEASSFSLRSGQSAQGLGMAFAGAASGGIGLGAMAWNPAAITLFPGRNSQLNLSYILPQADYVVTDPATLAQLGLAPGLVANTGNIAGNGALVPASYTNWQITPDLFVGWSTGAPWGLTSKPDNQNYLGQIYGRSSSIRTINVAPTIGWRVTERFSVGAALQVQYFTTTLKQAYPVPTGFPPPNALNPFVANVPNTVLEGDDIGFGFRLGATFQPWDGGVLGVGYRSAITHSLEGKFTTPGVLSTPAGALPAGTYAIEADVELPQSVTFGFSQAIGDRWMAHVGVEWTDWSVFDRFPVSLASNGAVLNSLNFEYDDSWYVSAGVEYAWNDRLTLRGGLAYEWSAVSDRVRNVRISDNDRLWVSAGLGYEITDYLRFDASYSHLFVKDAPVTLADATNPSYVGVRYVAEAKPSIDIVSVSLTYRWDRPSTPAQPAQGVFKP